MFSLHKQSWNISFHSSLVPWLHQRSRAAVQRWIKVARTLHSDSPKLLSSMSEGKFTLRGTQLYSPCQILYSGQCSVRRNPRNLPPTAKDASFWTGTDFCSDIFWITCGTRLWFCPITSKRKRAFLKRQNIFNFKSWWDAWDRQSVKRTLSPRRCARATRRRLRSQAPVSPAPALAHRLWTRKKPAT